jgi:hypothetical protein
MHFVCIYGPPATGKLTVAQALAKRTDFHIFHNHHTVDLVTDFFPFGSKPFSRTVLGLRQLIIGEAARANLNGIIFTFCYARGENDAELRSIVNCVRRHKGTVSFVQLHASRKTLLTRVKSASRKQYGKIKDPKQLAERLDALNFDKPFPAQGTLRIDSGAMSATAAAKQIQTHFRLSSSERLRTMRA